MKKAKKAAVKTARANGKASEWPDNMGPGKPGTIDEAKAKDAARAETEAMRRLRAHPKMTAEVKAKLRAMKPAKTAKDESRAHGPVRVIVAPHAPCLCGCGGVPVRKASSFCIGHDQRFRAQLAARVRNNGGDPKAAVTLREHGWPVPERGEPKAARA